MDQSLTLVDFIHKGKYDMKNRLPDDFWDSIQIHNDFLYFNRNIINWLGKGNKSSKCWNKFREYIEKYNNYVDYFILSKDEFIKYQKEELKNDTIIKGSKLAIHIFIKFDIFKTFLLSLGSSKSCMYQKHCV